MWVENTMAGSPTAAMTLMRARRAVLEGLLEHRIAAVAEERRQDARGLAFAAGRGVDVDELSCQRNRI